MTEWTIKAREQSLQVVKRIADTCRICGNFWIKGELNKDAVCPSCVTVRRPG